MRNINYHTLFRICLVLFVFTGKSNICFSQDRIEGVLRSEGFENIRHIPKPGKDIIFIENRNFKNEQEGLSNARRVIEKAIDEFQSENIEIIMLEEGIPIVRTYISSFGNDGLINWTTDFEFNESMIELKKLNDEIFVNQGFGKLDIKFYPIFRFKNSRLDVMYLLQLNINPTLEVSLWRGAKATAQIVFPLVNDYSIEEGKIRPGFLTLSQQFRLPGNLYTMITVGNFNLFRGGVDLKMFRQITKKIGAFAQLSYTATSIPMFDQWIYSKFDKITWKVGANYLHKPSNIILSASLGQYLGNDLSLRGEITRYFKNSSVGLYVQTMNIPDYPINGGFFFAISLPPYKHNRNKFVRVTSGDYFNLEYIARPYTQYARYFTTSPDENSSYNFFNRKLIYQIYEN